MVDYFVSSFCFVPVARSECSGSHSTLLRQGTVQLIVTAGPETEEFLDAHGDGIADIAFCCDDVAQTAETAVSAGASLVDREPGRPVISGFGDTRHTLVSRTAGARLPAGRPWAQARAGALQPAPQWIRTLDHVAVCLDGGSLEDCANFYTAAFGLGRYSSEYTQVGSQGMNSIVVRSPTGGATFTFLEPDLTKSPGQLNAFLVRNSGPGVQHLAFAVNNIAAAIEEYRGRGIEFLHTPAAYYELLAERLPEIRAEIVELREMDVLVDRDEFGYLLQLFTRSPHERNTLFCELIQRRGARGFGSANIKALYEAFERDRLAAG